MSMAPVIMSIDTAMSRILSSYSIRSADLDADVVVRFRRTDGLVDGGTIEHLSELRASQRALHDHLEPGWGIFQ